MARRLAHFRDPYLEMQIEELLKVINPIAEINVPTAVTSVSFTGLDGNAYGGYVLEALFFNPLGSDVVYTLEFNEDHTQTNYYVQYIQGNLTTASAGASNTPMLTQATANQRTKAIVDISIDADGNLFTITQAARYIATGALLQLWAHKKSAPVVNLTQIDIVAATPNAIGIGSRFRLFRRL